MPAMMLEERFNFGAQLSIIPAVLVKKSPLLFLAEIAGSQKYLRDPLVALRIHESCSSSANSRRNHARIIVHCRSTERFDVPITSAISATVMPPK